MLNFVKTVIFSSSLFLLGTGLNAHVNQDRDQYQQAPYSGNVVTQVQSDLNQVLNTGNLRGWQRDTVSRARHDLAVFDRSRDRGSFNRHEIDQAISRIRTVANSSRVTDQQREMLFRDIDRLQDFRSSQTTYSYGGQPARQDGRYDRYGNWHPYR